ncbi:MAG TPA: hypothetical protein VHN18_18090 [Micromonosporaceae bacterium]|nr:hypothetical protein [Micromonosporaceae bacterium]
MRARLASVAALAAAGLLVFSGCGRAQPGVAAYVGNTDIPETRVTAIIDEVKDAIGEAEPARLPKRGVVVSTLVLNDVCARFSADDKLKPQNQITPQQVAQAFGVPENAAYAQETAKLHTCLSGLPAGEPVAPTAEDLAEIVARGKEAGAIPKDVPNEQAAAQLDGDQLRAALANRKVLADAVARYDVTVNPRYRPLEFPVLSFQGNAAAVTVPVGEADSGAVKNVSTVAPAPDGSAAPGA